MDAGEALAGPSEATTGVNPGVQITLPALAENVSIVRHALAGFAAAHDMEPNAVADLKTVVTEAAMNVVVHAYGEEGGPLDVGAWREGDQIAIAVSDRGAGIRPRAELDRESLRLGLSLIAALSTSFEIRSEPGEGTRVRFRVPLRRPKAEAPAPERVESPNQEARIRVAAGDFVAPVLSRVIGMYAARADFSVDRLSDAILLSDAISWQTPDEYPDAIAQVAITEADGAFTVRLGPLREGGGRRLVERMRIPELGASLEGLANELEVESGDEGEFLRMTVARPG